MKLHVNFLFVIYMVIFSSLSYGEERGENYFKNKDVVNIKQSLIDNNLYLKSDGSFLDFKTYQPTKNALVKGMKENGSVYIFPNKEFYTLFLRYLDELIAIKDPALLMGKEARYKCLDGKEYLFSIDNNGFTIHVNVISPIDIDDSLYSESSYMYSFERGDGIIMLSKINVAG